MWKLRSPVSRRQTGAFEPSLNSNHPALSNQEKRWVCHPTNGTPKGTWCGPFSWPTSGARTLTLGIAEYPRHRGFLWGKKHDTPRDFVGIQVWRQVRVWLHDKCGRHVAMIAVCVSHLFGMTTFLQDSTSNARTRGCQWGQCNTSIPKCPGFGAPVGESIGESIGDKSANPLGSIDWRASGLVYDILRSKHAIRGVKKSHVFVAYKSPI